MIFKLLSLKCGKSSWSSPWDILSAVVHVYKKYKHHIILLKDVLPKHLISAFSNLVQLIFWSDYCGPVNAEPKKLNIPFFGL